MQTLSNGSYQELLSNGSNQELLSNGSNQEMCNGSYQEHVQEMEYHLIFPLAQSLWLQLCRVTVIRK